MKQLDRIRARIFALKDSHAGITALPPSRDGAAVVLERQLVALAADGQARLKVHMRKLAAGSEPAASLFQAPIASVYGRDHAMLAPLLAALLTPAALMNALGPLLASLPEGLGDADRKAQLAAIDAELWALELEEERLIVEAEARGEAVQRRADANPAAVLWLPAAVQS